MRSLFYLLSFLLSFSAIGKERIISLAPSITEIIYALGAGDELVGNTVFCNFPKQARDVKRIGFMSGPNKEMILTLKPTIVLGAGINKKGIFADLKKLSIESERIETKNIEQLPDNIVKIGKLIGREKEAVILSGKIKQSLVKRNKASESRGSFVLALGLDPLYSAGPKTWLGQIFSQLGFQNTANTAIAFLAATAWCVFSKSARRQ